MDTIDFARRALWTGVRPAALLLTILAFLLAVGFGTEAFSPRPIGAQPALELDGSCQPDPVRPDVPVLISCTVHLTNTGDEAATNLVANVFLAERCDIPSRFAFIDRTTDGELVPTSPLGLSFEIGDLAPGETSESVTRIAVENYGTGPTGGSVTIVSLDDPGVTIATDLCWEVARDAGAPPTNLRVTKTLLTDYGAPPMEPIPVPPPPPPPEDDGPVVIEPAPLPVPSGPDQAEFEIVVSNVSDLEMTDVTLLDVPTGGAVLVSADPPASGTDPLGRPTWDLGTLNPSEEFHLIVTYGPPPEGNCIYADDIAIVTATPAGGEPENYVAFARFGIPVGPCEFEGPDMCWHYPPEGDPTIAPCDTEVCWAAPPDGTDLRPVFDCTPDVEYCWFLPPGEGSAVLQPCAEDVCWFSFGPAEFEYFSSIPCDVEFCQFTAPDGLTSTRGDCDFPVCWSSEPSSGAWREVWDCGEFEDLCWFSPPADQESVLRSCGQDVCWLPFGQGDFLYSVGCGAEYCEFTAPDGTTSTQGDCSSPVCWSSPPEGGRWEQAYDCGEFQDWCWFSPPGATGRSVLNPCTFPLRFAVNPPEGAVDFGLGPLPVYGDADDACWPVPSNDSAFYTFPMPCDQVESVYWFTPPNDGPAIPMFDQSEACWQPVPPDISPPPDLDIPPDLLIPGSCAEGEEPKTGEPGSSVPAEVVDAESTAAEFVEGTMQPIEPLPSDEVTPAEIVEGTVEQLEPLPSDEVLPAELIRSDRTEPAPPDTELPTDVGQPPTTGDDRGGGESVQPPGPPGLLGPGGPPPEIQTLPDSGTGAGGGDNLPQLWAPATALAAAGLLGIALGARRRRRGL